MYAWHGVACTILTHLWAKRAQLSVGNAQLSVLFLFIQWKTNFVYILNKLLNPGLSDPKTFLSCFVISSL